MMRQPSEWNHAISTKTFMDDVSDAQKLYP